MKHRRANLLKGFLFVLILLVVMVYLPGSDVFNRTLNSSTIISIDKDVMFQWNEEKGEIVDLSEYSFEAPHRGDKITLQKTLPNEAIIHPVLVLELYHCAVDVYLDEEHIYTYGQEQYEKKKVLGHEFLRIPLPEAFQGKNLKVVLTITEEDGFTSMEDTYIINEGASYAKVLVDKLLTLLSCLTLITFGIIGMGATLVIKGKERDVRTLAWICSFSIIIAIWMLCNDDIMFIIISNMELVNVMEFFCVYLPGIPTVLFFANVLENPRWRKIYSGLAICNMILDLIIVGVHLAGIANYIVWIPVMHVLLLIIIAFVVYTMVVSYLRKEKSIKILVYGMSFMVIVSLFEVIRFNLYKYMNQIVSERFSLMPIGALIFAGSMMYYYCVRVLRRYQDKAEQKIIEKMAYTDMLTNTYNRNKCERILEEMEQKRTPGYLVSLDLNELKQINDNYGHSRGDDLIVNFSTILRETFESYECAVGRMGGDEFLIVMYHTKEHQVASALEKLNKNISCWNKKNKGDALSVAYGYAYYDGGKKSSVQAVYEEADQEMYRSKREIKWKMDKE